MPDLGHEVSFGVFLPNPASRPGAVVRLAQEAESAGLDLVGVQDHPYNPDLLDTWTLLSHLSAATETIRLFPDVACVPLRPPAVLARAAASLDLLSGGRVELGLGAGYFRDAIAGMGAAELSSGDAVTALEEAVDIVRAIWDGESPVTRDGRFHSLRGAAPGPRPAHPIQIWLGSYRPRMLDLTARLADGWVPSQAYAGFDEIGALSGHLDRCIIDAGRSPADVRRIYNVNGRFTMTGSGFLDGTPEQWAEQLTELVLGQGFSTFVLGPTGDILSVLNTFAKEVAPDVRERVANARAAVPVTPPVASATAEDEPVPDPTGVPFERISVAAMLATDGGSERSGSWGDAGGLAVADRPRVVRRTGTAAASAPAAGSPGGPAGPGMRDNYRDLVAIHDHLRSELVQIQAAVAQVAQGDLDPATARSLIAAMTLRQNHWTLGSFCASYCRIVTIHHAVEDAHMFPALARSDASLGAVLERLEAEHVVIADVLDRFDRALVALVQEPGHRDGEGTGGAGTAPITRLCDELSDLLLSHLAYEEDELADGLRRMTEPI
ncbi:LLM class flavin-dependent oxidoreductase [Nakamurella flava]|uniref:LLM class flavin-dependent oxidoreductase n=1 Tax=Nakamurella flava TaxID=2576308 RepID=A0A4U6QLB6_9ACTN|nr:LLM class flavin-dependent oxidoreductase [Nakamurella flava]TKV61357.1 LLM class flavin-dependent oxidoreductase [Nakamurella flava]